MAQKKFSGVEYLSILSQMVSKEIKTRNVSLEKKDISSFSFRFSLYEKLPTLYTQINCLSIKFFF